MAPGASSAAWDQVPFGEFLQLLRRNGFQVGLRHYARMMTLLEHMDSGSSPGRVRTMLAPLFATTPDQQERFYRLFDHWFPMFVHVPTGEHRVRAGVESAADETQTDPTARRRPAKPRTLVFRIAGAAAALVLLFTVWQLWIRKPPEAPVEPVPPPTVTLPDQPVTPQPAPAPVIAPVREIDWGLVRVGLALLIVGGFVVNEWLHYRRRRVIVERQRRERPPLVWPIRVDAAPTPLVESADFLTAARRLRERQTGERERLDVEGTIAATIRALGRPVFQFVLETRPPEYLVLIERASARDHQSRLYQHLMEYFTAEGVHAMVFWCDEDPRTCEPASGGSSVTLVELKHRFPSHRLLMFGSGDGLIDPITGRRKTWVGDAIAWPDRALLTPEPPDAWGAREVALAGHMVVLPATLAGLQAAIDHFQIPTRAELILRGRRSRAALPDFALKETVRVLKGYMGPRGLQWVAACAVYPDLQWHLTLHLGMLPELGGAVDDELLLKLIRLPWFRTGAIPDEARTILLRVIEPDVERAARRAIVALLERNPAPAQTIASSRFELDLIVQKFALAGGDRAQRRALAKAAQTVPRERVMRELAVMRMTEGDAGSVLAMRLPERMRDVFFQGGMPLFGFTSGARSVIAAALIVGVLFVGPGRVRPGGATLAQGPDSAAAGDSAARAAGPPATARPDTSTQRPTLASTSTASRRPTLSLDPGVPTVGDTVRLTMALADSLGRLVPNPEQFVTLQSTDTSVATILPRTRLEARAPGSAFIVGRYSVGGVFAVDSTLVVVRSRAASSAAAPVAPAIAGPGAGGANPAADSLLSRAIRAYEALNIEQAQPLFAQALRLGLAPARSAVANKYLGASFAVLAQTDSAVFYFDKALAIDPFTDLDPTYFSASEMVPFRLAAARVLRADVRQAPAQPGESATQIFYVTTARAQVRLEAVNRADTSMRDVLFAGVSEGQRVILWDQRLRSRGGLQLGESAPNAWELRMTATQTSATVTVSAPFTLRRLAPPTIASADDLLKRAAAEFNDLKYTSADTLARQALLVGFITAAQRERALAIIAASTFPEDQSEQNLAVARNAIVRLLQMNPAARIPRELSWPGLEALFEAVRSPESADRVRRATDKARAQLSGEWKSVNKVPSLSFGSVAELQRFTALIGDFVVMATVVNLRQSPGQASVDSMFLTGQVRFEWRDAFSRPQRLDAVVDMAFDRGPAEPALRQVIMRLGGSGTGAPDTPPPPSDAAARTLFLNAAKGTLIAGRCYVQDVTVGKKLEHADRGRFWLTYELGVRVTRTVTRTRPAEQGRQVSLPATSQLNWDGRTSRWVVVGGISLKASCL